MRTMIGILILTLAVTAAGPLGAQACGDCNYDGFITSADSLAAAQHATGSVPMPGPRLLNCDVNSSGSVDVIDALLIEQTAQGMNPPIACLPAGDCSVGQGFDPGLTFADFFVLQDHIAGTGIFGPPLNDAALAACDADGNGATNIIDLIHLFAATVGTMPLNVPGCLMCGDCDQNGTISVANDANHMFAALFGFVVPHARGFQACDVDNDNGITPIDIVALSNGILTCDLGPGTASIFGSGRYTISPGSVGTGVPWTFLIGGSSTLTVVAGTAVAAPGATPAGLANAWATAINGLPGFSAFTIGPTVTVWDANNQPAVLAVTGPNPYCLPGTGTACRFNGEMVGRDPDGDDPPVVGTDEIATSGSTPVTFDPLENDWLPEGEIDPSSLVVISSPIYGHATVGDDGTITVVMEPDYQGKDAGAYEVCGYNGACNRALFKIAVEDGNQPPVAVDDTASVESGGIVTIDVLANDSDPDGDPIKVVAVDEPARGTTTVGDDGLVIYLPDPKFAGTDSFSYRIVDEDGATAAATVTVVVAGGKR